MKRHKREEGGGRRGCFGDVGVGVGMVVWVVEVPGSILPQSPFLDLEEKERHVGGIGNNRTGTAVAARASGISASELE